MPEHFAILRPGATLGRIARVSRARASCAAPSRGALRPEAAWLSIFGLALVLLGEAGSRTSSSAAQPQPAARIVQAAVTAERIEIDGKLIEGAWEAAQPTGDFVDLANGRPAKPKTVVQVTRDQRWLYVAATCETEDIQRLGAERRDRNSDVFNDDSFEVLLDPVENHARVFRFVINSLGTRMDEVIPFDGRGVGDGPPFWLGRARRADPPNRNRWTAEMAIDLASLGLGDQNAETWRVNFLRHARGVSKSDSAWSPPRLWEFGCDRQRMGTLAGMERLGIAHGCRLRVTDEHVRVAETVLRGRVGVEVLNEATTQRTYDITLRTTTRWLATRQVDLAARTRAPVEFPFEMALGEEPELKIEAMVAGLKLPVAALARVLTVPPPIRGWFDRSYYSADSVAVFQADIGLVPAKGRSMTLRLFDADKGRQVWQKKPLLETRNGEIRSNVAALVPLKRLPVGGYLMEMVLEDPAMGKRFRCWTGMRRLAARQGEIKSDANGFFRRDGAPFYPLEVRRVDSPDRAINEELKSRTEFNVNWGWYIYYGASPIAYSRNFFKATGCLSDISVDHLHWARQDVREQYISRVRQLGTQPFMFAYSMENLPGNDAYSTEAATTVHQYMQNLDPHRPFHLILGDGRQATRFRESADFLTVPGRAVTPHGIAEPEWIYEQVRRARRAAGPRVPIVALLPAYRDVEQNIERPTPEQMRAMTYLALVGGAAGLIIDGYHYRSKNDPQKRGFSHDPPLRETIYILSRHVAFLAPILMGDEPTGVVTAEQSPVGSIRWTARRYAGNVYVIAVNASARPARVAFRAGEGSRGFSQVREIFENKLMTLDGPRFSVEFESYAAHVFGITEAGAKTQ